ncbi:GNAT family N-acetyltransferase [Ferrimonas marina]|uniref:Predicted N-acetyltransferase YhbS n=1 Tax=Ferrimonas marina TaxID=299255 RepID=A0A1M5RCM2_9GAMM|nr:GNAT family N-acetyltransferase [Ferrimonas marina]SHH23799.1 Predicted N-acetyltransferase YhbS [Ferrimonas marina]
MNIEVSDQDNPDVFEALATGVRAFNAKHLGNEKSRPLLAFAKDEAGKVIAGVAGRTIYNQFLIEVLWVDESTRGEGLGRKVMMQAENEAKARGCVAAQVDTLGFQAPDFYQKLGFEVVGKVTGIPNSPERVFLVKRYDSV